MTQKILIEVTEEQLRDISFMVEHTELDGYDIGDFTNKKDSIEQIAKDLDVKIVKRG